MASSSVELQSAIFARLVADTGVHAVVADRIYDSPPAAASRVYPDITFGPSTATAADADCFTGSDETIQIDCWARDGGRLRTAKTVCAAVKAALHDYEVELATNALVEMRVVLVRVFQDPDGLTAHGVVQVMCMVDEA